MNKDFSVSEEWFNESWNYRKSILIETELTAPEADYQISIDVTYDAHMQTDFDDIRFTDNDGETLLDHWLEIKVDSTSAVFWVEVKDYMSGNDFETIYMYYGNEEASTTSNGTATFIFFDDFENNNLDRWDEDDANWATTGAQQKYGSYSVFGDADDSDRALNKVFSPALTGDFMIHVWQRTELDTGTEFPMFGNDEEDDEVYFVASRVNDFSTYDGDAWVTYDEETAIDDTWIRLELAVDNTYSVFRLWIDRVAAADTRPNLDGDENTISGIEEIGSITSTVEGADSWLDDYYVRNWVRFEPSIHSWGEEETQGPPPEWNDAGDTTVYFHVPFDYWAFDMILIFLGLGMIILSSLYAAYKIRNDPDMDTLIVVLLLFMFGCALFLGGIGFVGGG